ncbi:uncharacterized protein METZ01_LOCUS401355 [marine metagenome]|uniref:Uncharacterized protein n=1 Tax=marine metagenome TaxID=408172 RepID=A0A382VRF1_9ZZZZ
MEGQSGWFQLVMLDHKKFSAYKLERQVTPGA